MWWVLFAIALTVVFVLLCRRGPRWEFAMVLVTLLLAVVVAVWPGDRGALARLLNVGSIILTVVWLITLTPKVGILCWAREGHQWGYEYRDDETTKWSGSATMRSIPPTPSREPVFLDLDDRLVRATCETCGKTAAKTGAPA